MRTKHVSLFLGTLLLLLGGHEANAGLVGFYPFDDAANPLKDASGKGQDLQGGAADPKYLASGGFEGGAYQFDGTQRLVSPININSDLVPTLTMGAWVKTYSLVSGLRKVIGQDDGGWDRVIGLDDRATGFSYSGFNGSGVIAGTPGPVNTNDWTFLAATYDQNAQQVILYFDLDAATVGPLIAVTNSSSFSTGFDTTAIGGVRPDNANEGWVGLIDNVFFYDEVLSRDQLTAIRDRGKSAILGTGGDDPDLVIGTTPDLQNLPKTPAVHDLTIQLKNGGSTKPLHITGVTVSGPDAAYYSVKQFPTNIATLATSNLLVQFDPKGQVGNFEAAATIASDDPTNPSLVLDLSARVVRTATLVGFYSFDDSANPLKDDSGRGHTLQQPSDAASQPSYAATGGIAGGDYQFNGAQRLIAPININPASYPLMTMGAWVRTDSLDVGQRKVLGQDNGGWDRVIGLDGRVDPTGGDLPDGTLRYVAFTGGVNTGPTQGNPPPAPTATNAWTFLAAVYDQASNQVSLYIDLDASSKTDAPQVLTAATAMDVGETSVGIGSITPINNSESWLGAIDNVFFIADRLDAAAIKNLRDNGKQALLPLLSDPGLVLPTDAVFGALSNGSPKTASVVLRNGGATQALNIVSAKVTGANASRYTLGTVPQTIPPGGQVTVPITFDPAGTSGAFAANLELITNDSYDRKAVVDLLALVPNTSVRASLIGFYPFDDAANPLADKSGHTNNLQTVEGTEPVYGATGGVTGGGYEFDGSQHLIAPININMNVMPLLTMGAWVKTASLDPGLRKVMGQDDGGWDRVIGLDNRNDDMRYTGFNGSEPVVGTPHPESVDAWTFIAASYNQPLKTMTIYVDLDVASTNDPLVQITSPTAFGTGLNTTAIGSLRADNTAEGWVGSIDNVFFYDTALTADQLTTIRNGGAAAILADQPVTDSIKITSVTHAANQVVIAWTSTAGKNYAVQYTEKLGGTWNTISTQAGTAGTTSYTDSDPTRLGKNTGFYRITLPP